MAMGNPSEMEALMTFMGTLSKSMDLVMVDLIAM